MKKLVTVILCLGCVWSLSAQVPQAVCYQAVATDATGVELVSAPVGIRFSVLQGALNGPLIWQETHSTTTDDFGLFNLDIGTGERTDGTVAEFSDISWRNGPYFLRVEMDAAGGSNFVFMGANQLLSVPYSLYAEGSARSDTASFSFNADVANTAISADTALYATTALTAITADTANYVVNSVTSIFSDTAFVAQTALDDLDKDPSNEIQDLVYDMTNQTLELTGSAQGPVSISVDDMDADPMNEIQTISIEDNVITLSNPTGPDYHVDLGSEEFGAPGASADFPLGILGESVILTTGTYIVPFDKEFFVTAGGPSVKFRTPSGLISPHPTTPNMPVFEPNAEIVDCMCTGILVNASTIVEAEVVELNTSSDEYIVPSGKTFFLKSGLENSNTSFLKVNGIDMEFLRPNFTRGTRIINFPAGTVLRVPTNGINSTLLLTGYLIDNDL